MGEKGFQQATPAGTEQRGPILALQQLTDFPLLHQWGHQLWHRYAESRPRCGSCTLPGYSSPCHRPTHSGHTWGGGGQKKKKNEPGKPIWIYLLYSRGAANTTTLKRGEKDGVILRMTSRRQHWRSNVTKRVSANHKTSKIQNQMVSTTTRNTWEPLQLSVF